MHAVALSLPLGFPRTEKSFLCIAVLQIIHKTVQVPQLDLPLNNLPLRCLIYDSNVDYTIISTRGALLNYLLAIRAPRHSYHLWRVRKTGEIY